MNDIVGMIGKVRVWECGIQIGACAFSAGWNRPDTLADRYSAILREIADEGGNVADMVRKLHDRVAQLCADIASGQIKEPPLFDPSLN